MILIKPDDTDQQWRSYCRNTALKMFFKGHPIKDADVGYNVWFVLNSKRDLFYSDEALPPKKINRYVYTFGIPCMDFVDLAAKAKKCYIGEKPV